MIIPKLWARLGNQCYMIAAAIAHAKKMDTRWSVPRQTTDPRIWPTYFAGLPICPRGYAAMHWYEEKRHCYDALPLYKDMLISGYFQSEKYFEYAKPEIQLALGFNLNTHNYCALHIRRGDYLQYQDQFPVLDIEYYNAAIAHAVQNGCDTFCIYTDDQKWFKDNVSKFEWYGAYIIMNNEQNALQAMRSMYNAYAFIISNSTFSLFPATLRSDNPLIIAPAEQRWFGPANKHLETCDLMPSRFVQL